MVSKKDEVIEEAPFNMSMLFYIELHELRKLKSKAFISGHIIIYRDCLEEIYTAIAFKLNKKEREGIESEFSVANKVLVSARMSEFIKVKNKLRVVDMGLMDLMHKYKMIFPNIKSSGGLKGLLENYKL